MSKLKIMLHSLAIVAIAVAVNTGCKSYSNALGVPIKAEEAIGFGGVEITGYNFTSRDPIYSGDWYDRENINKDYGNVLLDVRVKNTGEAIRNIKIRAFLWNQDGFPIDLKGESSKYAKEFVLTNIEEKSNKRMRCIFEINNDDAIGNYFYGVTAIFDILEIEYFDGRKSVNPSASANFERYKAGARK